MVDDFSASASPSSEAGSESVSDNGRAALGGPLVRAKRFVSTAACATTYLFAGLAEARRTRTTQAAWMGYAPQGPEKIKGQLFDVDALHKAMDDIYRYPLRPSAIDTLNRQLRSGVDDTQLAEIVMALREEDRLCDTSDAVEVREPQIICSLGLFDPDAGS